MQKRFPLATVLLLREQRERAEERALAVAFAEVKRLDDAMALTKQHMADHGRRRAALLPAVLLAAEHQAIAAHWAVLVQQLDKLHRSHADAERRRTEQQARYMEARRDREMLSKLKEQHASNWQVWSQRLESKAVDDYVSAVHTRRN